MTCIITRPEPQTLFDRIKSLFSAKVLGGAPVIPDTNEWYVVSNDYLAQELYYSIAEQQWRETDPRHMCCDNLVEWAARRGMHPRPASFARGYVKLSGTPGASINPAFTVQFGDVVYKVDAGATVPSTMPDVGYTVVRMIAQTAGEVGNGLTVGASTGTLGAPMAGISNTVEIYGGEFCSGREAEDCETFRTRVLARFAKPHRTRLDDITDDLRDWPCVTRAMLRSCSCCAEKGRLDMFVFMDDSFEHGIPPQAVLDDMTAWYFGSPQGFGKGVADYGMEGQFYAATTVPVQLTISNLPCSSQAQVEDIRYRIGLLFADLAPGAEICRRMIDAIVIQVIGFNCEYDVVMVVEGRTLSDPTSFVPECDELPIIGSLKIIGGSLTR